MYLTRQIESYIEKVKKDFPVIVICGPRQVGKSTMLNITKDSDVKYVTLDDLDNRSLALNDPKYFLDKYGTNIIIDEIQYAPNLLSYIKMKVDEYRLECLKNNIQEETIYWLTGSQQFSMMKGVTESLAGRAAILDLASMSLSEIDSRTNKNIFYPAIDELKQRARDYDGFKSVNEIFEVIFNGGMPAIVAGNRDRETFFSSYVRTYIERDIRDLSKVGKITEFYTFLQYLAVRTAQELNCTSISKEVGVDVKTIQSWVSILEASGIIFLLQPYSNNATSRLIKRPKVYFMDTGLCSWLAKWPTAETLETGNMSGAIFETFVVSEIVKSYYNHGKDPKINLFYFRDKDGHEVDLIFVESDKVYPIEIKKAASPTSADKNFSVLDKFKLEVMPGVIICMSKKLEDIKKDVWLCPVELI